MKMKTDFNNLEEKEKNTMYSLPIYVAVLIAAADGNIDKVEIRKAISFTKLKFRKADNELIKYYDVVNRDYEDKLKWVISNLPVKAEERNNYIFKKLSKANIIFEKIHKSYACKLYASFKDIAIQIAKSSGGFFGYRSIGPEEAKLVELEMINNPVRS